MSTARHTLPLLVIPRRVFPSPQAKDMHDSDATEIITIGNSKIYLGAEHDASKEALVSHNIKAVVRVIPEELKIDTEDYEVLHINDVNDSPSVQISKYFNPFEEFMDKQVKEEKNILVHCHAGISRSATLVISYIMKKQNMNMNDAMQFVKSKRKQVWPNFGFCLQLMNLESTLFSKKSPI